MSKLKSSLRIIELSNFVQPVVEEKVSQKWVTYGEKNSYFNYLIDRSRGSATNGAVIQSLVDIIFGAGMNSDTLNEIITEDEQKKVVSDLYSLGQAAIQVQWFGDGKTVEGTHIPVETLAPEKANEDGEIEAYYFSSDWTKVKPGDKLDRLPVFTGKKKEGIEVIYIKPYRAGLFYFSTVSYQGGLQYAELEEEIGNYHVNNIQNGMAPSMLINMNNGVPKTEEKAREIEKRITAKYQGSSNAGRIVLMFNDNKEAESTITPIELSDAADQYTFLSTEASQKILTSHRVTSSLLVGLNSATGFSSNSDEIIVGFTALEHFVARPFRMLVIEQGFDLLLEANGKSEDLEFETINPFVIETEEVVEPVEPTELSKENLHLDELIGMGEDEDLQNWILIDEREVEYEYEDDLDAQIEELNNPKETLLQKAKNKMLNLVSTGTARPNASSQQDGENIVGVKFKVRYQYAPLNLSVNSREFCTKMVVAAKIYRKEDIIMMGDKAVNPGWGPKGVDTYSIWLYKGGGTCHHKWFRKTYIQRSKTKIDINSPLAPTISTTKARQEGFRAPSNDDKVAIAPVNMPNKGFLPGNPQGK